MIFYKFLANWREFPWKNNEMLPEKFDVNLTREEGARIYFGIFNQIKARRKIIESTDVTQLIQLTKTSTSPKNRLI